MSILKKSNEKVSVRRQINIKGVQDGILLLPHNQYRAIYEVSSVNFELKSEDEQDALIDTYESFLNSLPCPIQIILRIRELDMGKYLSDLQTRLADEKEEVYKTQIENYSEFIGDLVTNNSILSRRFYVVIPCGGKEVDFEIAKEQLSVNGDLVSKGFARLGIRTRQLDSLEILHLFQQFYNPRQAKEQPVTERVVHLLGSAYIQGEKI